MREVDVAVIGAGIAGLTAARGITAAGRSVLVLEARDRVGGRTEGHALANGSVVEAGGQHVGPGQTAVLDLIAELGLETFPTYDEGDGLTLLGGSTARFPVDDETLGLPEVSLPEIACLQAELEALAATVPGNAPWTAPDAEALDRQTLETWLVANSSDDFATEFFRYVTRCVFTCETWETSLLHFLFTLRGSGMLDRMLATTGGAQERRIVGGAHRICERLAEDLGADAVRLGSRVDAITQGADGVSVAYDGGVVSAGRVIVTLPPSLAGRLRYDPPLPPLRDALTQQTPMGWVIKVQAAYPEPFWRDAGLSGQVVSFDDPVGFTFDNSPHDESCGVMLGFITADHARQAAALSPDERRKLVIDCFVRRFGEQAAEPLEYTEKDWMAEEFSRGCYSNRLGAGAWTAYGPALAEPVGRLHWAGSETADVFNGYMDGAVRSGHRAAAEVLAALP